MNTDHMRNTILLLLVLGTAAQAPAQLMPRANLYSSYTTNLFQNYNQQAAWITHAFIDLDLAPSEALNLYYTGSANVFTEYEDLFSHTHRAGLSYVRPGEDLNLLYVGTELALRLDRPLYDYRDFLQAEAYATAKVYLRPTLLSRAGYSLRYQEYLNAGDYSFFEQEAFAQLSRFFSTRTTLQWHGELGLKTYARNANTLASTGPTRSGGDRNLAQLVSRFKIAQSLGASTGLQLEYLGRVNLAGQSRYTVEQIYNPDDDLFDDRYSYDGNEFKTTLKHLAPWGLQVEMSGRSERRRYAGRPALGLESFTLESGETRRDSRNSLSLGAEKSLYLESEWVQEIRLQLEWLYSHIDSNDLYYQTDVQVYSTGIQIDF